MPGARQRRQKEPAKLGWRSREVAGGQHSGGVCVCSTCFGWLRVVRQGERVGGAVCRRTGACRCGKAFCLWPPEQCLQRRRLAVIPGALRTTALHAVSFVFFPPAFSFCAPPQQRTKRTLLRPPACGPVTASDLLFCPVYPFLPSVRPLFCE